MRLFSNPNGVQVPYAPISDWRLLLDMSLFSKKYSNPKSAAKESHYQSKVFVCVYVISSVDAVNHSQCVAVHLG